MARIKRVQGDAAQPCETEEKDTATAPTESATAPAKKPKRRRRGRTSSERGRAFRKRQDNQEALLAADVERLRQEIHDKQFLLSVCEAKYLRSRHSIHGSLVQIAVEYFRMFQFGFRHSDFSNVGSSPDPELIKRQEAFVHSVMDPNVIIGLDTHTTQGPEAVLEQWRLRTQAAPDFSIEIASQPVVIGPDENPIVQVQLQGSCRVTPQFINAISEVSARSKAMDLLKQHIGKTMNVSIRVYLQFSPEKRITLNVVQTDYVQSFVDLGLSLQDVAELLKTSAFTPESTAEPPEYLSDREEKASSPARAF